MTIHVFKNYWLIRCHNEEYIKEGKRWFPADGEAWQVLNNVNHDFAYESHNIYLGLESHGFNLTKPMSIQYSMWHVILMPYNLPSLMCINLPNCIMALLISR